MCVSSLSFGRGSEDCGDIIFALDVGLGRKVQITTIRLRFPGESILQILQRIAVIKVHVSFPSFNDRLTQTSIRFVETISIYNYLLKRTSSYQRDFVNTVFRTFVTAREL